MTEQKIEQEIKSTKAFTEHQLRLFAFHITCLKDAEANDDFRLNFEGLSVDVRVHDNNFYLKGKWVGNSQGAAAEYARLVFENV